MFLRKMWSVPYWLSSTSKQNVPLLNGQSLSTSVKCTLFSKTKQWTELLKYTSLLHRLQPPTYLLVEEVQKQLCLWSISAQNLTCLAPVVYYLLPSHWKLQTQFMLLPCSYFTFFGNISFLTELRNIPRYVVTHNFRTLNHMNCSWLKNNLKTWKISVISVVLNLQLKSKSKVSPLFL